MPTATSIRPFGLLAALALLVGCGDAALVTEATLAAKASNQDVAELQAVAAASGKGALPKNDKGGKGLVVAPVVEEPVVEEPVVEEPVVEEPVVEEPVAEPPPVEEPAVPAGAYDHLELYVDPVGNASLQAVLWSVTDPDGAALMEIMADQPIGMWLGEWSGDIEDAVDDALDEAGDQLRVLVAYNIPNRDCGNWSAGGLADMDAYEDWIDGFAAGIGGREVIVVLEPDALAVTECLDDDQEEERLSLLSYAVDVLGAAGASVYIDAGDSNWIPSADMADQLIAANVANAAGFALNVSHTEWTANEIEYAEKLRALVGNDAHYVIDTSRNGTGPNAAYEWCNPLGLAVGQLPTLENDVEGLDAYLWIKPPGESDGECNGGPEAGHWWPEYAVDLMIAGGY